MRELGAATAGARCEMLGYVAAPVHRLPGVAGGRRALSTCWMAGRPRDLSAFWGALLPQRRAHILPRSVNATGLQMAATHPDAPAAKMPGDGPEKTEDGAAAVAAARSTPEPTRQRNDGSLAGDGSVVVIGLSHHTAKVEVRERLAVPEELWKSAAVHLTEACPSVTEVALLSTCNRFEVYLVCSDIKQGIWEVTRCLSQRSGIPLPELRQSLFMLINDDAVWHLLRVSAGLDSLVVGEGQILSQVKRCYELAIEKGGMAGKLLTRLLNASVSAGKRVRTETGIAKGAVSISSAAVELMTMRFAEDLLGVEDGSEDWEEQMKQSRVCVVGAGAMARLLVTHLLARGARAITIVNRSAERAEELIRQFPDASIERRPMTELLDCVAEADVVFTSTSATEPILDESALRGHPAVLSDEPRNRMFIDISVPRNIAEDVANVPGVYAYNVDDLKAVVARNQRRRRRLVLQAEELLRHELRQFRNWQSSLGCIPAITRLQDRAEEIRLEELSKVMGKLHGMSDKERGVVERLTKGIVNKLLHGPLSHLRGLQDVDERRETLRSLENMFKL
ncbi:hypothetical protein CDCA_CDCA09G2717 [Cyanidium caldarium]|uniref:Glutamyl-tRNA reductase n=1 Tax=Cyanidium caldarium TaxID=2771 RepID=A0AAV9IWQ0_CYACA|nr:hypothetical protein CDCA_CDCA09G2717 [Cyanidium caldarium]